MGEFLDCMYTAIRVVLQGERWGLAFDRDGFGQNQAQVSTYIRRQGQLEASFAASAARPGEEQLRLCFPYGARVHLPSVLPAAPAAVASPGVPVGFRLFPRVLASSAGAAGGDASPSPRLSFVPSVMPGALEGRAPRTRSEHRLAHVLAMGRPFADN